MNARPCVSLLLAALAVAGGAGSLHAQDLAPRAYVITPLRSNAVTLSYSYNDGELLFEGTVPITDATGRLSVPMVSYYRSFGLLGRSANVLAALPYGVGTFEGTVFEQQRSIYRSGLFDSVVRVSVNLVGGPAMPLPQMRQWRQKTLLGASLKVIAPTGQYDPTKLINLGSNRWTFKPELGLSRAFGGHWVVDAYASVWFFTRNPEFFSNNPGFPHRHAVPDPGPDRGRRAPPQLRRPAAALGVARRQLLVRREDERQWRREPEHPAEELPRGDHGLAPPHPAPVPEGFLRSGRLHPLRRRLPDPLGGVAVLLD